jgi:ABC-2 type transport system permease protein
MIRRLNMIRHIFRREITGLFRTPFAWVVLSTSTALIAYQFLSQIEFYLALSNKLKTLDDPPGVSQLVVLPTLNFCALLLIFLVPIVTMQSIAGERRGSTLQLIISSPVNLLSFVVGKFLGLSSLFMLLWIITGAMIFSLSWGTRLDLGLCFSALLGIVLFTAMAVSIGLLMSSLFKQPAAAGAASLGTLLFAWYCDWVGKTGGQQNAFSHLAAANHFDNIASGLFDTFDLSYFIIVTILALLITDWRLINERYNG